MSNYSLNDRAYVTEKLDIPRQKTFCWLQTRPRCLVSGAGPALILAAAGVGFGHAVMPDHWLPLAVVGRMRRYPLGRVARLSGMAGLAHVLVSVLLGAVVIAIGLQFRSVLEHAQDVIVGTVLMATGLAFMAIELSGRGLGHGHDHPGGHTHGSHGHHHHDPQLGDPADLRPATSRDGTPGIASAMIPFGAAASPDLTILPVFLAASAAGASTAVGSLLAFGAVTIATIVALTLAATVGGYQVRGRWLDRWGNSLTAATLVLIGALVLSGII